MPLTLVITDAGRAALVNAAHDGTDAIRIATAGVSSTAVAPSGAATALPGERKRLATIPGDQVAPDMIHLVVQDDSDDTYQLRSFGLYLADETLFAIYGQAAPIIEKSAQAVLLLAIDVKLADIAASTITFGNTDFIDPPATTERRGVVELATDAEAVALADTARAVTPKGLGAAFTGPAVLQRLLQVDGAGSGLDADLLDGRNIGTSGDAIPSLAGNNSWGWRKTYSGSIRIDDDGVTAVAFPPPRGLITEIGGYSNEPQYGWFGGMRVYRAANVEGVNFTDLRFFTTEGNAAERMCILGNGRVGIGTPTPLDRLHVAGGAYFDGGLHLERGSLQCVAYPAAGTMLAEIGMYSREIGNGWFFGMRAYRPAGTEGANFTDLRFYTTSGNTQERMRITEAGRVGIRLNDPASPFHVAAAEGRAITTSSGTDYTAAQFNRSGAQVGAITCGETSTAYNITSDYRLKQDVVPLTGALERLAKRFAFKAVPDTGVDGFLAHEVGLVVPEAVHGAKDAVDANGAPVFQQIDQSKIVPLLVAALQELATEVVLLRTMAERKRTT